MPERTVHLNLSQLTGNLKHLIRKEIIHLRKAKSLSTVKAEKQKVNKRT